MAVEINMGEGKRRRRRKKREDGTSEDGDSVGTSVASRSEGGGVRPTAAAAGTYRPGGAASQDGGKPRRVTFDAVAAGAPGAAPPPERLPEGNGEPQRPEDMEHEDWTRVLKQLKAQRKLIARQANQISALTDELTSTPPKAPSGAGGGGSRVRTASGDSSVSQEAAAPRASHEWERQVIASPSGQGGTAKSSQGGSVVVGLESVAELPHDDTPRRRKRRSNAASSVASSSRSMQV